MLSHCPPSRACVNCPLWNECGGRARAAHCHGFLHIDDAIVQKGRVGHHTWQSEMLCERPNRSACVYAEFDRALHVFDDAAAPGQVQSQKASAACIGGMDFGYRAPTVILWAMVRDDGMLEVFDEICERGRPSDHFIACARRKSESLGCWPQWIGADPAGHQRNEQTGCSTISLWKSAGFRIRTRTLNIEAGLEAVRAKLLRADGSIGLHIHRRCTNLIEAMTAYHYPHDDPESSLPVKDGPDHACDALRYMITNLDHAMSAVRRRPY